MAGPNAGKPRGLRLETKISSPEEALTLKATESVKHLGKINKEERISILEFMGNYDYNPVAAALEERRRQEEWFETIKNKLTPREIMEFFKMSNAFHANMITYGYSRAAQHHATIRANVDQKQVMDYLDKHHTKIPVEASNAITQANKFMDTHQDIIDVEADEEDENGLKY